MSGFKPSTDYFYLGEIKDYIQYLNNRDTKRISMKNEQVGSAIQKELEYFKGDKEKIKLGK